MRRALLTLALAASPGIVGAQGAVVPQAERQLLPLEVRREVVERWNSPRATAVKSSERLQIEEGHEVRGDVLVRRGPLVIAGHVTGDVLALNSDVILRPTARIDGDVLVVGGELTGRMAARVDGSTRIYRQMFDYREEGDKIVDTEEDKSGDENWWRRLERRHQGNWSEALRVVQAGPYNRVEGLPIELGPVMNRLTPWGSVRLEGAAVVRTASSFDFDSDRGDIGHKLRAEVRVGRGRAVGFGGTFASVVEPVESWQLSDLETALAAFVSRRDYRDYYQAHGASGQITLYGQRDLSLTASYGQERWSSRGARNPFTIFDGSDPWRPNPLVDEGLFHIAAARLSFDTRTDPNDPWSGWFLAADIENGRGTLTQVAPMSTPRTVFPGDKISYTRGFFDFRRYNRLGPSSQLNMRLVLAGWLSGDELPLERRVSVDGPGTLPGFDFRNASVLPDVATCNNVVAAVGRPTECERIALAQIEYRGDLRLDVFSHWDSWPRPYRSTHGDAVWVLFADAGRGWKVGPTNGGLTYSAGTLPPLSTFRTDVGLGLDFGGIGVYVAKAVSTWKEPANFFVRLKHRL